MTEPYRDVVERFWQQGFLVIEDFFAADIMAEIDAAIRGHFGDDPAFFHTDEFLSQAQTEVIPWFPQNEGPSVFDRLDGDDALQGLTTAILGEGWRSDYCMVMFSKRGTSGQAWHQDCPPENASEFNLNRLVYTSDISDEIGGQTVVVPGSFRRGVLPVGDPVGEIDGAVTLRPRRGTLVLLHGHTWHRVLPIKGAFRYSTNYRAAPRNTSDGITDVCVYRNMRYRFSTSSVIEERR
ncbi:MAG: phytanoyl-CoA dioxygenase family protein [Pseudomonadota bacterium]